MRSRAFQPSISGIVTGERVQKYWHILGILNHLSSISGLFSISYRETLPRHQTTSNPLSFEAEAIILSLNSPDHDQVERALDALLEEGLC
jgi:hypothetical protein